MSQKLKTRDVWSFKELFFSNRISLVFTEKRAYKINISIHIFYYVSSRHTFIEVCSEILERRRAFLTSASFSNPTLGIRYRHTLERSGKLKKNFAAAVYRQSNSLVVSTVWQKWRGNDVALVP